MVYRFADCELDEQLYQLRRNGASVAVEPKVFDVLVYLLQHRDRIVSKDELLDKLWPGKVVGEAALTRCIRAARAAVGDDGTKQEIIETQHGRGYRFVAALAAPAPSPEFRVLSVEGEIQKTNGKNQKLNTEEQAIGTAQETELELEKPRRTRLARQLAVGCVLLVALFLAVRYWFPSVPHPQSLTPNTQSLLLPDKPSIAVLPFTNMSGDPEQEYFSDGLTDDLITDLSRISSLFVIARYSTFTYKGKAAKVQEISKELGVRYVLEGSVRKTDAQIRINAQLVDATTGRHLWSERYDRPITDIFALQDEIREKIVLALKVKLTPEEQERFRRAPTNNLDAYDYYLHGWALVSHAHNETKKETNEQGRQMLEQATALDPQYAAAYAGLGFSYWADALHGWSPNRAQSLEQAFTMAQRGVTLDESLPLPHMVLGWVYVYKKHYELALTEAKRAITLDPNYALGYAYFSLIQGHAGQPQGSLSAIEKAMRLNPRYPDSYLFVLGFAYRNMKQCEEALTPLKKFVVSNPNHTPAHVNLAICYAELDRFEEARTEIEEAQKLVPKLSLEEAKQNWPYKNPADLERILTALRKAGLK